MRCLLFAHFINVAFCQASVGLAQGLDDQYALALKIAQEEVAADRPKFEVRDGNYFIFECEPFIFEAVDVSPKEFRIQVLATEVANIQYKMKAARIKGDVYKEPLQELEAYVLSKMLNDSEQVAPRVLSRGDQLSESIYQHGAYEHPQIDIKGAKEKFYREVESRRQRYQNDARRFVVLSPHCAAMIPMYRFNVRPPGARVWIISKFSFELCRARGISEWDVSACSRWNEVDLQGSTHLFGRYVYLAKWPGGSPVTGVRDLGPKNRSNVVEIRK